MTIEEALYAHGVRDDTLSAQENPHQQVEEHYRWRMADNIRDRLPPKTQLYYDRWRSLQQV
jgi:hypothetical protein